MEIRIGRESGKSRLSVVIDSKQRYVGAMGSVPQSVSRQHCILRIDDRGDMNIENVKLENVTSVDGLEISRKRIEKTSRIELGRDKYLLPLKEILCAVYGQQTESPKAYSLRPLQVVWEEYEKRKDALIVEERKKAALRSLSGILSSLGIVCSLLPLGEAAEWLNVARVLFVVGSLLSGVYFFWKSYRNADEGIKRQKELEKDFRARYVCPNPECGHFMGAQHYDIMAQMPSCPYCHCKYTVG